MGGLVRRLILDNAGTGNLCHVLAILLCATVLVRRELLVAADPRWLASGVESVLSSPTSLSPLTIVVLLILGGYCMWRRLRKTPTSLADSQTTRRMAPPEPVRRAAAPVRVVKLWVPDTPPRKPRVAKPAGEGTVVKLWSGPAPSPVTKAAVARVLDRTSGPTDSDSQSLR